MLRPCPGVTCGARGRGACLCVLARRQAACCALVRVRGAKVSEDWDR